MKSLLKRGVSNLSALTVGAAMVAGVTGSVFAADHITIRIASDHGYAPHPAALTEIFFAERLAEEIPGSVVRSFPQKSLYSVPAAVEAATEGNVEMVWGQFGKTAQIDPYMSVVVGPMLMTTPGAINSLDETETYKMLVDRFAKIHGMKILGSMHLSFYMGAGSGSRLLKPEDFAGKKIRSMGPAENAALSAWGANPTTMAFGDVPPALQTKVIDGLLTSLGGFNVVKDQAPYFTVAGINGIVGDYYYIGASQVWWDTLTKKQQNTIERLWVDEAIPFAKEANWCNDKQLIDRFGTEDPSKPGIYVMAPAEAKVLADKLGDATQQWIKSNTPKGAHEWVDTFVKEARAASEANPIGSNWLEKTDCSKYAPWFAKYAKKKKKK
jgi:TRAP-type C4-dicarboxylate transport system substrate-binding protein